MLQTKIISDDACAVAWDPTEIMVRKRGRDNFGKEKTLARIRNGELIIDCEVAREFGISIQMLRPIGHLASGNSAALPFDLGF